MKFKFLVGLVIVASLVLFIKIIYSGNFTHLQDINAPIKLSILTNKPNSCNAISAQIINPKISAFPGMSPELNLPFAQLHSSKDYFLCEIEEINYPVKNIFINVAKNNIDTIQAINLAIGNKIFVIKDIKNYIKTFDNNDFIDISSFKYSSGLMNTYGTLNLVMQSITYFLSFPLSLALAFGVIFSYILTNRNYKKDFEIFTNFLEKRYIFILFFIVVLGGLFRFNGMHFYSLWGDEIYSSMVASNIYLDMKSVFVDPGNPPFYFFLLKIWFFIFGFSEVVARSLSVVIGILGILSIFLFAKNHINIKTALIASLFYALSYQLIGASHEVRGYVLTMAFVPLIANYFLYLIKDFSFKNILPYFLVGICAVNTHYYASIFYFTNFLFAVFIWFYESKTKDLPFLSKTFKFLGLNILVALSLMPYFYITAYSKALVDRSFNTWIPNPSLNELFLTSLNMIGSGLLFVLFIMFFIYTFSLKNRLIRYCIFSILLMVFVPFLLSFIRPIFVPKYSASIIFPFIIIILSFVNINLRLEKGREIIFLLMLVGVLNTTLDSKVRYIGYGSNYSVQLQYMSQDSKEYKNKGLETRFLLSSIVAGDKINFVDEFYKVELKDGVMTGISNLPTQGILYIDNYFSSQEDISKALEFYKDRAAILKIPIDKNSFIYKIIIN